MKTNRFFWFIATFGFVILFSLTIFAQTTYYVSNSQGNDSNNGTSQSTPWRTLSKVTNASLNPGDKVLFKRGDTWTGQQLNQAESGTINNPIVFGAYGEGSNPVFNGNNSLSNYIFRIESGRGHIVIQDITAYGLNLSGSGTSFRGVIRLEPKVHHVTIKRCTLSVNTATVQIWGGGVISMLDPNNITVDSCDISGTHYGVFILCNYQNSHVDSYNLVFTNNYFHDFDPRPINSNAALRGRAIAMMTWWGSNPDMIGDESVPGTTFGAEGVIRDVLIDNNRFERILSNVIDWYWHHNFTVAKVKGYNWKVTNNIAKNNAFNFVDLAPIGWRGGLAEKSIISGNVIDSSGWDWNTGQVFSLDGEGFVNVIQTHNWDNWIIENNIISNIAQTQGDGNAIIMDYTLSSSGYKCDSIIVRNNILWGALPNDGPYGETAACGIQLYTSRYCEVYNNIIYGNNHGIGVTTQTENALIYNNTIDGNIRAGIYSGGDQNTVIRNNILTNNGTQGLRRGGTQPGFIASHNLFYGNGSSGTTGTNNQTSNPNFINRNIRDYRVNQGGAGIDNGTVVAGYGYHPTRHFDFAGNPVPHNNAWDIGAYEFGSTSSSSINVNIKVLLEGPFNNSVMSTTLLTNGHLPLTQPYNSSPWNYGGTESVTSVPSGVVDWVLVSIRSGTSASTSVATRAAFIKSDGTIVDLDGNSRVTFSNIAQGNYYVVIKHRNHISIMSRLPVSLSSNSSLYDFSTSVDKAFGNESQKSLGNGKWGMYAGDGDYNSVINVIDYGTVGNFLFETGYKYGDLDMNGVINVIDYGKTNQNLFKVSQVPN